MKSAKELRKPLYDIVEELIGRPMNSIEHDKVKDAIQNYFDGQEERVKQAFESAQRSGARAKSIGTAYYTLARKKGVPEETLVQLKKFLDSV